MNYKDIAKVNGERELSSTFLLVLICFVLTFSSCVTRRVSQLPAYSQINSPVGVRYLEKPSTFEVDSLIEIYGVNKTLIDEYSDVLIVALSYYPELKGTRIKFEYSNEKTTMACRPSKLIFPRTYRVLINKSKNFDGILFDSIPYNAAIGIVGYELAHIVDYESVNFLGLIDRLLLYANKPHGKPCFERRIDLITINRGLGWQLYDWAKYAMYDNSIASEEYKLFKRETYLTPDEIKKYIAHYSMYNNSTPFTHEK